MERAEVAASERKSASDKLERRSIKEEERYKVIEAQFSAGVSAKRRSGGGPGDIASKYRENKRPKDLKRAIGKLDKDDWNNKNIEEKLLIKKDPEGNETIEKNPLIKSYYETQLHIVCFISVHELLSFCSR